MGAALTLVQATPRTAPVQAVKMNEMQLHKMKYIRNTYGNTKKFSFYQLWVLEKLIQDLSEPHRQCRPRMLGMLRMFGMLLLRKLFPL